MPLLAYSSWMNIAVAAIKFPSAAAGRAVGYATQKHGILAGIIGLAAIVLIFKFAEEIQKWFNKE